MFINDFAKLGTDKNKATLENGEQLTWNHFHIVLPREHVNKSRTVSSDAIKGKFRTTRDVFTRALNELTLNACETAVELIDQGSLYRGTEFRDTIRKFMVAKLAYDEIPKAQQSNYTWIITNGTSPVISNIRTSAIGTLLVNLSEDMDLNKAVGKWESVMAPTNYKRPVAIATKGMIESAEKRLDELGLKESLGRRMAHADDIAIDNLLFVDRGTKEITEDNIFDEMKADAVVNPKSLEKVEEVSIDDFLEKIVPTIESAEVFLENSHGNNLMALVTSKNETAPSLFKWNSPISWSYVNALTDSIKERVKSQGGSVDGELSTSLSWHNLDDLDIHVYEPRGGRHIYFGSKKAKAHDCKTSGVLDVDMNAGGKSSRSPVENIIWTDPSAMLEGEYRVVVNNYNKREASSQGYTVQIECRGEIFEFTETVSPKSKSNKAIVEFTYTRAEGIVFKGDVKSNVSSKTIWGMDTYKFHKVNMIMNSPNYWGKPVGNMHTFFILEDSKTDEAPRGFFNEFLNSDLDKERKVFEMLGNRLKVELGPDELSGVGFSSTQRNHVIMRVTSKFSRLIKIKF